MTDLVSLLREKYQSLLQDYLAVRGEEELHRAYELGRQMLASDLSILDTVLLHHDALSGALADCDSSESIHDVTKTAGAFLTEFLSPLEMSYRVVEEANATLQSLNQILEEEARRIAYALHDEAGSLLASTHLSLARASRSLSGAERERMEEARELLLMTGEQLRQLSHDLRPTVLDDLGLAPALENLARSVSGRSGLDIQVHGEMRQRLPSATEIAIYRVVKEALHNSTRHAQATRVTIRLVRRAGQVCCAVEDDGIGFDVTILTSVEGRQGLGLMSMRERLNAVGGNVNIHSTPGKGTCVEINVPLEI